MRMLITIRSLFLLSCLWFSAFSQDALGQQKDFNDYPDQVAKYLERVYEKSRTRAGIHPQVRDESPKSWDDWQRPMREKLHRQLGIPQMVTSVGEHQPTVQLDPPQDLGDYVRRVGMIETEPNVTIAFWMLQPKSEGPWPLALFPHGHDRMGHKTTAGVYDNEQQQQRALAEDRDVAVQAVKRGFLAIAPAIRGLSTNGVPDLHERHGRRDCRSHLMHCLLAGRTAIGERVWDMQRIIDWATQLENVNSQHLMMMGNSGGGMVTLFTAACDERVKIAVPSCSFAPSVSQSGYIFHCDCNMVPGLLELDGLPGVARLIAPRRLLAVNGRQDPLFSVSAIERAIAQVKPAYLASGYPERFQHRWGAEGHRFYSHLMWPYVMDVLKD